MAILSVSLELGTTQFFLTSSSVLSEARRIGCVHTLSADVWRYTFPSPHHAYLFWAVADKAASDILTTRYPATPRPAAILIPPVLLLDHTNPADTRIVCVTGNKADGDRPNRAGFLYSAAERLWYTRDLRKAITLKDLADPPLARRLAATASLPFDRLTEICLDAIALVRDLRAPASCPADSGSQSISSPSAQKPASRPKIEDSDNAVVTFDRASARWVCDSPATARWEGFTQDAAGLWITSNPRIAARLRGYADDSAEMAVQRASLLTLPPFPMEPLPAIPSPPGLAFVPEQIVGVHAAATRTGLLIADEMGVGKTGQGLGLINLTRPRHVLVVAPAKLVHNWLREATAWLVDRTATLWRAPRRHPIIIAAGPPPLPDVGITAPLPPVLIVSYESLHRAAALLAQDWDLVIADEIQENLNRRSRRGRAFYNHSLAHAKRRLALTGTPIWNRPQDLFSTLNWLAPDIFTSAKVFHRLYGVTDLEKISTQRRARLEWLGKLLRQRLMIRRLKEDVMTELPPLRRELVFVDVPLDQLRRIAALDSDAADLLEREKDGVQTMAERAHMLTVIQRLRKETFAAKLPRIEADLAERLRAPAPLILFIRHREHATHFKAFIEKLGHTATLVTGHVSPRQRQLNVNAFQAGLYHVAIASLDAGGTGYTMTAAAEIWCLELDWTVPKLQQMEARAHRRGQILEVITRYYVIDRTIDARIARTLVVKADLAADALADHHVGFTLDEDLTCTA
jgi:hypothetical protein